MQGYSCGFSSQAKTRRHWKSCKRPCSNIDLKLALLYRDWYISLTVKGMKGGILYWGYIFQIFAAEQILKNISKDKKKLMSRIYVVSCFLRHIRPAFPHWLFLACPLKCTLNAIGSVFISHQVNICNYCGSDLKILSIPVLPTWAFVD